MMARCEDFPCCGHELGCCPDFDPDTGQQLNMVCTCGAKLPIDRGCSICDGCLRAMDESDAGDPWTEEEMEEMQEEDGY